MIVLMFCDSVCIKARKIHSLFGWLLKYVSFRQKMKGVCVNRAYILEKFIIIRATVANVYKTLINAKCLFSEGFQLHFMRAYIGVSAE